MKSRSPLKRRPLRNPGESLQEQMEQLLAEEVLPAIVMTLVVIVWAIFEWALWVFRLPPQPVLATGVAIISVVYAICIFIFKRKRYKNLQLGLEGEKAVGQYLEDLRSKGCRVFHDIPSEKFNIDHIVVSQHGILIVETKTYSKPTKGNPTIQFDGQKIRVNGVEPDRNSVVQARALRNWLNNLLLETTDRQFPIKCAIVFPGWFVEPMASSRDKDLWVINPRALPAFIDNEPLLIKEEDVALVSSRIINYVAKYEP